MDPVLGIDLGGTTVDWVVLAGDLAAPAHLGHGSCPTGSDRTSIVADLTWIVRDALAEHSVRAVGVGVPGHVDRSGGVVRFLPNLPGDWADYPLGPVLDRDTGVPATLLNDARAFCLAEHWLGAARGHRNALFVTLGTGVGGGVVTNGRLLVGPDDRLGEIGHLIYERDGRPCGCGSRGCLEAYASGPALVTAFEECAGTRPTSAADVFAAAEAGDGQAAAVVARAGTALGETLASLCAVLPSDIVVVGGGVAAGLPQLWPHIDASLAARRRLIGPVDVAPAELGRAAGAIGAALAALGRAQATDSTCGGDRELDPASA